jgi:hypothetical protein
MYVDKALEDKDYAVTLDYMQLVQRAAAAGCRTAAAVLGDAIQRSVEFGPSQRPASSKAKAPAAAPAPSKAPAAPAGAARPPASPAAAASSGSVQALQVGAATRAAAALRCPAWPALGPPLQERQKPRGGPDPAPPLRPRLPTTNIPALQPAPRPAAAPPPSFALAARPPLRSSPA